MVMIDRHRAASLDDTDSKDAELMGRLSCGDVGALESLHDRYGDLVYFAAWRMVRDSFLAEDISQEVFLRLWRAPEKYVPQNGRFISWLHSVTRNRAVDELRIRQRRSRREASSPEERQWDAPAGDVHDPALAVEQAELERDVRPALLRLPLEMRQAIEMAYFDGLTQREIAHRLGLPLGTVKSRIRRGVQKMQATSGATDAS
jgi:RNA polymerase sigma-70 factor (ECF subfamily)